MSSKKFEILENSRDDDSYMYSYTDYTFSLVIIATGDCLQEWHGTWNQDSHGDDKSGIESVRFSPTEDKVIAHGFDGTDDVCFLPKSVEIINRGKQIRIIWPDDQEEIRDRNQVMYTTKYGQPYSPRELIHPPHEDIPHKKKSKSIP